MKKSVIAINHQQTLGLKPFKNLGRHASFLHLASPLGHSLVINTARNTTRSGKSIHAAVMGPHLGVSRFLIYFHLKTLFVPAIVPGSLLNVRLFKRCPMPNPKTIRSYGFTIDLPISLTYDQKTGVLRIESVAAVSGETTGLPIHVDLTAEAAVKILGVLQALEKDLAMPPSAHARQKTEQ